MSLLRILAFDEMHRRFYARATGMWDTRQALAYHEEMIDLFARLRRLAEPVNIFVDLRCLAVHTGDVALMLEQTHQGWEGIPVEKFALIVDGVLMKLQSRRVAGPLKASFFDTVPDALVWLGWDEAYLATLTPPMQNAA